MPPSHHSSSSHSSRSHSSGGSFRSPSSHSSSSRSSFSSRSSGSGRSFSGSRGGPSAHSASSRSSFSPSARSKPRPKPGYAPSHARRPRTNQPRGFFSLGMPQPRTYYGRRHDYVYYPESWTDPDSGVSYEKGYYDENGQYYDSVAFAQNGKYENVVCRCPYCDTRTVLNLDAAGASGQSLKCPGCGAPMEILSQMDELTEPPTENTHSYRSEESLRTAFPQRKKSGGRGVALAVILIAVLVIFLAARTASAPHTAPEIQSIPLEQPGTGFPSEERLYLKHLGDGAYRETGGDGAWDKRLIWDEDADSFYDPESDCWLWYNTDVEPPLWQYWYEGISSDFGDWGWMEHEASGWYIEAEEGTWIPLPDAYESGGLWYIED